VHTRLGPYILAHQWSIHATLVHTAEIEAKAVWRSPFSVSREEAGKGYEHRATLLPNQKNVLSDGPRVLNVPTRTATISNSGSVPVTWGSSK